MVKLDKFSNGGSPIIYYYDVDAASWSYGSFAEINTESAGPASIKFNTNDAAAGGLFDHAFVFRSFTANCDSLTEIKIGGDATYWGDLDDVRNAIIAELTTADHIFFVITDIDNVGYNATSNKVISSIGFDIYVA